MRESRLYGSVRGARGNSRPYREVWVLLHLLTAGYGTDRRTGVCGMDRCYQASSRHQPACQAPLPRLKMTLNRHARL
jgi:hypothetical protein